MIRFFVPSTTFILLILILFLYSEFHGKKDYQSSKELNKININEIYRYI